jgi:hypothetical protein
VLLIYSVSPSASSKQFFAVRDKTTAKPELLRKFQEWRDTKVAFGEVRAFRRVSSCCKGKLKKSLEPAPFLVSVAYDDENNRKIVTHARWCRFFIIIIILKNTAARWQQIPNTFFFL